MVMNGEKKKPLIKRVTNFKVVLNYLQESLRIIKQGARLKDKLILIIYYTRIPITIFKSLIYHKTFRELEEERGLLISPVIIKNKNGILFCEKNITSIYVADQNYEKNLYPWFELSSGTFIDVGAHIGKYTVKLGRNSANKVISLEPEENNFSLLKKNVALNKLENTICINKGVYSCKSLLPFYISVKSGGTHSILKNDDTDKKIYIPVDTLDNIIDDLGRMNKINLVKIDAEGSELEILKGAKNLLEKDHPRLIIEIWNDNSERFKRINEFLLSYNYSVSQSYEDNFYFC